MSVVQRGPGMLLIDHYFPRYADHARVMATLVPALIEGGPDAPAGVVLTAMPGTGLTSFLHTELCASPRFRDRRVELLSLEPLAEDIHASRLAHHVGNLVSSLVDAPGGVLLWVDHLQTLDPEAQANLLERLAAVSLQRDAGSPLQFVLGLGGIPSAAISRVLEARPCVVHLDLPPLGMGFINDLVLSIGDQAGVALDPGAVDAIFRATGFKPGVLKSVLRELVHSGHSSLEEAAAAVGVRLPEVAD